MNFWRKHWFLMINIIAFVFALFDSFNFPIYSILGCVIASILGGIFQAVEVFKFFKGSYLFVGTIGLCCSAPFYGL